MRLIKEFNESISYLTEETKDKNKPNVFIEGVFLQSDLKNKNGRVYPKEIMQREVNRYVNESVNTKRAYGELGHPEGPTINLERASHMITALYPDGKNFIGEAKILSTPMGEIVKTLMDEGAKLGVSSRGMGSLEQKKDGASYVRDDFYLATAADIVSDPSAPNAFVEGIMEGKEWVWNNGALVEAHVADLKKKFDVKKHQRQVNLEALEFAKFLEKL